MAKKSMIEREKKRIKLNKKYALKRASLLKKYQTEENFNLKLELHSKLQKLPRNSAKTEFEIDVGKLVDLVEFLEILDYHVMFFVKWLINVYYLV
jgi:ribosomal protein L14E/L6E/L27E